MRTHCTDEWKWVLALLIALGIAALGMDRLAAAGEPASLRDGAWTWGYVIPGKLPGPVPYVFPKGSSCSLETAAKYLDTPNVVLMNYEWPTPGYLERVAPFKRVLCGIPVRKPADAARLSAASKKYPNIVGGMIDDFLLIDKPPVDQIKALYTALKSQNPSLKLYVVRYTNAKDEELIPYLPYIDVINLWVWEGKKEEWGDKIDRRLEKLVQVTHKPVVIGLYLHDYGVPPPDNKPRAAWSWTKPLALDVLEAQYVKTTELFGAGKIEGFIVQEVGWMDDEAHRPQVQWIKQYLDWLFQTQTVRH